MKSDDINVVAPLIKKRYPWEMVEYLQQ